MYTLVYIIESTYAYYTEWCHTSKQPLITYNLDNASLMSLEEAKKIMANMPKKHEWEIWSVRPGFVLNRYYEE